MNTIQEQWQIFFEESVDKGMPPENIQNIRSIFYCGAMALLRMQNRICNDKSLSPAARDAILIGHHEEIDAFASSFFQQDTPP